jgi:hypothetical protein
MNTEFYRLIGSLQTIINFIRTQHHDVVTGEHGPEKRPTAEDESVKRELTVLDEVIKELLKEQASISHAMFDFRRAMSRNAERYYHAVDTLRRKAPEWQLLDEDLLALIECYQQTASGLFFGGHYPSGGYPHSHPHS